MKLATILLALLSASLGSISLSAQRTETRESVIYRMKSGDWKACNALHGAVAHDTKGWYCAIEQSRIQKECSKYSNMRFTVGGTSTHLSGNTVNGKVEPAECILRNSRCWNDLWIDGIRMPDVPCKSNETRKP